MLVGHFVVGRHAAQILCGDHPRVCERDRGHAQRADHVAAGMTGCGLPLIAGIVHGNGLIGQHCGWDSRSVGDLRESTEVEGEKARRFGSCNRGDWTSTGTWFSVIALGFFLGTLLHTHLRGLRRQAGRVGGVGAELGGLAGSTTHPLVTSGPCCCFCCCCWVCLRHAYVSVAVFNYPCRHTRTHTHGMTNASTWAEDGSEAAGGTGAEAGAPESLCQCRLRLAFKLAANWLGQLIPGREHVRRVWHVADKIAASNTG